MTQNQGSPQTPDPSGTTPPADAQGQATPQQVPPGPSQTQQNPQGQQQQASQETPQGQTQQANQDQQTLLNPNNGPATPLTKDDYKEVAKSLLSAIKDEGGSTTDQKKNEKPPSIPTIGGCYWTGYEHIAWTGGKPNDTWTDLDDPTITRPKHQEQHRSYYYSTAAKDARYRRYGLETKFSRKDSLPDFLTNLEKKLINCGLDTITYVRDPMAGTSEMISVLEHYPRLDIKCVRESIKDYQPSWDDWDRSNDADAKKVLFNSLEQSLHDELQRATKEESPFAVVFMQFVDKIQVMTFDWVDKIKDRIKARKATDYAGQSISLLCDDLRNNTQRKTRRTATSAQDILPRNATMAQSVQRQTCRSQS